MDLDLDPDPLLEAEMGPLLSLLLLFTGFKQCEERGHPGRWICLCSLCCPSLMIQGSDFKKHCEAAGMLIEALPNLFDEVCSYQGEGGEGGQDHLGSRNAHL